jgi:hypothetical protein
MQSSYLLDNERQSWVHIFFKRVPARRPLQLFFQPPTRRYELYNKFGESEAEAVATPPQLDPLMY